MSRYPILGRSNGGPNWTPVVERSEGNLICIAKPRTGKSRSIVAANLVTYEGSVVVANDVKGQAATETAMYRAHVLGQDVKLNDPFRLVEDKYVPKDQDGKPCYGMADPLDFIANSYAPRSAAGQIAKALLPEDAHREPHWAQGAQLRLIATMMFVKFDPLFEGLGLPRNMISAWMLLSDPEMEKASLELMALSDDVNVSDQAVAFLEAGEDNKEMTSIRNHLRVACGDIFNEPAILNTMASTNVDFSQINKRPTTVYNILPGEMSKTHNKYTRLLNVMQLSGIERGGLRQHDSTRPPTLYLVDEFNSLGNFAPMVDAMARLPGYGVKFYVFLQNLSQLRETYRDSWSVIMGNCETVVYFGGSNDPLTCEEVSRRCGETTRVKASSSSPSNPGQSGSTSWSTYAMRCVPPDEVARLQMPQQLVIVTGKMPCLAEVFSASLNAFPQYLAFQAAIDVGSTVSQALAFMEKKEAERRHNAVKSSNRQQAPEKRKGFLGRIVG